VKAEHHRRILEGSFLIAMAALLVATGFAIGVLS
jgi:hypothetical protein